MKYSLPLLVFAIASSSPAATLSGLWEFNDSTRIGKATVGTDLTVRGSAPAFSNSVADDSGDALTGVITTVPGASNSLLMTHGIAANGGGSFVNEYTLVFDVFSPAASRNSWRTLFQTNSANTNDGDFFIRNNTNALGTSELGYSTAQIVENQWTRLVVTVDNGSFFRAYADGVLLHTFTTASVDGRYALNPTLLIAGDNDTDNAAIQLGAVAIFSGAMTSGEVATLGNAGMAIPEASVTLLGGLGLLALLRRRRA